MAKEEFEKLGFATEEEYQRIRSQAPVNEGTKEGTHGSLFLHLSRPARSLPFSPSVPPAYRLRSPPLPACIVRVCVQHVESPPRPDSLPPPPLPRPILVMLRTCARAPSFLPSFFLPAFVFVSLCTNRGRVRRGDAHPAARGGLVV